MPDLALLREAVANVLAVHPEVLGLYLFGSQVTGEATERSDVDQVRCSTGG